MKNFRDWFGITGQWLGVGLFALVILKYIQVQTPWQYTIPLIAGWAFAIATKIRRK
ncbi:unnamed protein product [marine sediment metagenome]|uniref:Uncharacterized protein n=1 Tax=marine sediment metagenome TaxID=412755 RepID=X1KQH8_9ZZZZ